MYTDPIADFLTRIRNAAKAGHKVVSIPSSNTKKEMTKILKDKGLLAMERLMGMILTTMSVQMLLTGIEHFYHLS